MGNVSHCSYPFMQTNVHWQYCMKTILFNLHYLVKHLYQCLAQSLVKKNALHKHYKPYFLTNNGIFNQLNFLNRTSLFKTQIPTIFARLYQIQQKQYSSCTQLCGLLLCPVITNTHTTSILDLCLPNTIDFKKRHLFNGRFVTENF